MKDIKLKKFETLVWRAYSQNKNYDKLSFQLLRIRKIMIKHKEFKDLSAQKQFDQCLTIGIISVESGRYSINQISAITPPKEMNLQYAPESGFKEPEKIDLNKGLTKI